MRLRSQALLAAVLCGALLGAVAAVALPKGYKEDFNGCARNDDVQERESCCQQTHSDCGDRCREVHGEDFDAAIRCSDGCLRAALSCRDGKQLKAMHLPGRHEPVPGVEGDQDGILPAEGVRFTPARDALLVDARPEGDAAPGLVCSTLVVRCRCPAGAGAPDARCRARLEGDEARCQRCVERDGETRCDRCPDCLPVVQSIQACEVSERPSRAGDGTEALVD